MQPVKFSTFNLDSLLLQSLETLNYTEMTPIQAKSLPFILNGDDIIAKAKTGVAKLLHLV